MRPSETDDVARQEAAAVDNYVRQHFGVDAGGGTPAVPAGDQVALQRDEDEQFDAYMARHFPRGHVD